jgi:hypothetical protein
MQVQVVRRASPFSGLAQYANSTRLHDLACQTGRVCTSRPAKKGGRSVKRKEKSNADVMYMCVHVCHVALLCCLLVHLCRLDGNEGVRCETRDKQQDTG